MPNQRLLFRAVPRAALYLAFAITGAVTNLLGPMLPELERQWRMDHRQSGELFTLQFAFSTLTSIIASRNLRFAAPLGMVLIGCGVFLLSHSDLQLAKAAVILFGAGLGFSITSINLLVAFESAPERTSFEVALLNFIWVAGAIGFALAYSYIPGMPWKGLLAGLASLAILSGVTLAATLRMLPRTSTPSQVAPGFNPLSLLFALFFFLYVGVEVGLSGWLPLHVSRVTQSSMGATAVAIFWGAMLTGRLLTTVFVRYFPRRMYLFLSLGTALLATLMLAYSHSAATLLFAAGIAGAGMSALFPLNLAWFAFSLPGHRSGWVLACGGLGAALLPALMGAVSTHNDSIRVGLVVPMVAVTLLMVIASFYREPGGTEQP